MKTLLAVVLALGFVGECVCDEPSTVMKEDLGERPPIALPEFQVATSRPWLFIEIPGCQILSVENRSTTAEFARLVSKEQEFFEQLVPEVHRVDSYTGSTVILGGSYLGQLQDSRPERIRFDFGGLHAGGDRYIHLFAAPKETGRSERAAINSACRHWAGLYMEGYRRMLLDNHRELPEWYREGIYRCGIMLSQTSDSGIVIPLSLSHRTLRMLDLIEAQPGETEPPRNLWPLARMFAMTRPDFSVRGLPNLPSEEYAAYKEQCVLFLHWGLRGGGTKQREDFRKFVAAACEKTADEALFRSCFGFGLEEGQQRLQKFCADMVKPALKRELERKLKQRSISGSSGKNEVSLKGRDRHLLFLQDEGSYGFLLTEGSRKKKPQPAAVRPAGQAEIFRILGEVYFWSALDLADSCARETPVPFLNSELQYRPVLDDAMKWYGLANSKQAVRFVEKARKLVDKLISQDGLKDPELLSLLGIMELRAGNKTEATSLLQKAVSTGPVRPAAYVDLARLQLDQAMRTPQGADGRPSHEQVEPARNLLRTALLKLPEMNSACEFLAYSWGCSAETPTNEDLVLLNRRVRWYPANLEFVRQTAALWEKAGNPSQASVVARTGLYWVIGSPPKGYMSELRRLAELSEKPKQEPASKP